jgi:hypothetical protein
VITVNHELTLAAGVIVESLDKEVLVVRTGSSHVLWLVGEAAGVVADLHRGVHGLSCSPEVVDALRESGVVVDTRKHPTVTRRTALTAGFTGLGLGVTMLALPTPAFAQSVDLSQVSGQWFVEGGGPIFFEILLADYPELPSPPTSSLYSVLTVSGKGVPYYGSFAGTVLWAADAAEFPDPFGDFTGFFTADGQDYEALFSSPGK